MEREYSQDELLVFCQAMANVAASDGRVTEDERQQLDNMISGIGLNPREKQIEELVEKEFASPGPLTQIVARLKTRELKVALLRMLVEVACVDGEIERGERDKLAEASKEFGFDDTIAGELIDWTLDSIRLEMKEKELMGRLMA